MHKNIEAIIKKYKKVVKYLTTGGTLPDGTNLPKQVNEFISSQREDLFSISYKYGRLEIKLGKKVYRLSEKDIDKAIQKIELSEKEKAKQRLLAKQNELALDKLFDKVSYKAYNLSIQKLEDPTLSTGKIVSELREATNDMTRDWHRVAITVSKNNQLKGQAEEVMKTYGSSARVFKRPALNCCKYCEEAYLEPGTKKPKIFTIEELTKNGTNYGRKAKEWKAVLGTMHPNCLCELGIIPEGFEFDDDGELVLAK
jgi:hypothetical protein